MSELRVPTLATPALVVCTDGRELSGRVFVPVVSSTHEGPMRPEEVLNGAEEFFPFLPDDGRGAVMLNKREVLVVTVDAVSEPVSDLNIDRAVAVECPGRVIEGHLHIDMPSHHRRVLDYLNRPEPFLAVHQSGKVHLVQRRNIILVRESRQD